MDYYPRTLCGLMLRGVALSHSQMVAHWTDGSLVINLRRLFSQSSRDFPPFLLGKQDSYVQCMVKTLQKSGKRTAKHL